MRRNFQDLIKNPPPNAQREQKPQQPAVVQVAEWNKALEYLDAGDINKAYEEILISEDDLYLLRLMTITGPCGLSIASEDQVIDEVRILEGACIAYVGQSLIEIGMFEDRIKAKVTATALLMEQVMVTIDQQGNCVIVQFRSVQT